MSINKKQIKAAIAQKEVENDGKKPMRQIIIETDGTNINIVKADVAGSLELVAILQSCLGHIANPKK